MVCWNYHYLRTPSSVVEIRMQNLVILSHMSAALGAFNRVDAIPLTTRNSDFRNRKDGVCWVDHYTWTASSVTGIRMQSLVLISHLGWFIRVNHALTCITRPKWTRWSDCRYPYNFDRSNSKLRDTDVHQVVLHRRDVHEDELHNFF